MRWLIFLSAIFLCLLPVVSAEENCTGTFNFNPDFLQFGDEFKIISNDINYNNELYTGNLVIDLIGTTNNHEIYAYAYKGKIDLTGYFANNVDLNSVGNFKINIRLLHGGTTVCNLNEVDSFEVSNELTSIVKIQNSQINPGEALRMQGDVSFKNGNPLQNGQVVVTFEGKEYRTVVSAGKFDFSLATSFDIKSNMHELNLKVEDDYGNFANENFKFYINPIVSRLELQMDGTEYDPGSILSIKPIVYDQAGEEIFTDVEFRIYDPKENRVHRDTLLSGQNVEYKLESSSRPGTWIVRARYDEVIAETKFTVKELIQITTELQDQILTIKNVGNVKYNDALTIIFKGEEGEKSIQRRTKLDPEDEITVDLYKEMKSGIYNIEVKNTGQVFENIELNDDRSFFAKTGDALSGFTGNAVRKSGSSTSNVASYLMLVFLFLIMISVILMRYNPNMRPSLPNFKSKKTVSRTTSTSFEKEEKSDVVDLGEKMMPQEKKRPTPKKLNLTGRSSKDEINDFRNRILKDIKETEKVKDNNKKEIEMRPWAQKQEKQYGKFEFRSKDENKKHSFDKPMTRQKSIVDEDDKKDPNLFKIFD